MASERKVQRKDDGQNPLWPTYSSLSNTNQPIPTRSRTRLRIRFDPLKNYLFPRSDLTMNERSMFLPLQFNIPKPLSPDSRLKDRLKPDSLEVPPSPPFESPPLSNLSTNWSTEPRLNPITHARTHANTCLICCSCSVDSREYLFPLLSLFCQPCIVRRTAFDCHLLLHLFSFLFSFSLTFESLVRMRMRFKQLQDDMPFLFEGESAYAS